jgi:hypothetical protein
MSKLLLNQLQPSKIQITDLYILNHFVHCYSRMNNLLGKSYSTRELLLSEPNAVNDPWEYRINQYGYRGDDWEFTSPTIPFFGCSFVFGIGVNIPVSELVQSRINVPCYNLGQPGANILNILKTFISFNNIFPTTYAIIVLPGFHRLHLPKYNDITREWEYHNIHPMHGRLFDESIRIITSDVILTYVIDYIDWASAQAQKSNTTILWSAWDSEVFELLCELFPKEYVFDPPNQVDYGRDAGHYGPITVKNWADIICNKYQTQPPESI